MYTCSSPPVHQLQLSVSPELYSRELRRRVRLLCGSDGEKRSVAFRVWPSRSRQWASLPDFLPKEANDIQDASALQLLRRITRFPVKTEFSEAPVLSSCVPPNIRSTNGTPPLMLLHGFDSSCLEWRRGLPALEDQGLEAWAMDILGWGFSAPVDAGVTSFGVEAKRAHLVEFWREHMGGRPAVVVGPSLGGAAAIDLALHHPEMVAALVLVDAQGFAEGVGDMAAFPDWLARAGVAVLKSVPLRLYAGTLAYHDQSLATRDAMRVGRLHCLMPGWEDAKLDFMKSGGYNVATNIPKVSQPTLVVWGEQDRILETTFAKRFVEELQDSSLEMVHSCGHLPHLEKAAVFAQLVNAFVLDLCKAKVS